jgi:hypothetical protein
MSAINIARLMLVTVDLVSGRWTWIATAKHHGRRSHMYRYDTELQRCHLICLGLRDSDLLGQIAEVSLEHDGGGPVVTIHRRLPDWRLAAPPRSLSGLIWPKEGVRDV